MKNNWFSGKKTKTLFGSYTIWVLLLFLSNHSLPGQTPYVPETPEPLNESWRWRPIEVLSTKGVRCMVDDLDGNMWFGLDKGIMRYNGSDWQLFDDQPFLQGPVGILSLTRDGRLVAGSEAGLLIFENGIWTKVFPLSDSLQVPVTTISEMPDGTLLAGIQNGLLMVNDQGLSLFTVLPRANAFREAHPDLKIFILPDELLFQRNFGRVDNIFIEEENLIWLFMSRNNDGRLLKFNLADTLNRVVHKFEVFDELGGFKLPNRNEVLKASDGKLWIINGFYKSGILRLSDNRWEQLKLSNLFGGDELHTDILELSDGSIWVGGLGKLFVFKDGKWKVFSAPALPIPSSRIIFHESRYGQVWIAGIQGDVFRISYGPNQWVKYQGLNFQQQDPSGVEWFISVEGMVVYNDNGKWFAFDRHSGLIDAPVRLVVTENGRVWVAGSHQGVAATAYLENGGWEKQIHPELSWGIDPRSVFQDRNGSLWFGASVDRQEALGQISGVLQLTNPDAKAFDWKHHTQGDGIVQHNVYGIGQSPDGALWLGGTNLLKQEGNRWQTLPGKEQLNEFVDIVHSRQNLWVGSRYYGVFRFDGKDWTQFTNNDGLPSNTIISIFEESPEKVWVITDRDIALFDGQRWFAGMFNEEFRMPREGGDIFVDHAGVIWINKSLREWKRRAFPFSVTPAEAMEDFWTVRYRRETMPPKTTIDVYSEKVDRSGNTLIGWTGRDFWEETPASQLTYSYRINQGEWSEFSPETSVVLTKLGSGKHVFEVRARDLDLNVETQPASVTFMVTPAIWKQPWFIALVISFLFVIGFYEARLINRNKSLSKLNASLSDANQTLENRQMKIELQKETILKQKEELERKALILEEKTAEITSQRDQLKEMVEKVEELSSVKQRFFTNISHEFRTPLTLILGSIERLLSSSENVEKSRLTLAYEIIQRNSKRILRLINQILEIRKIETGKLGLNLSRGHIGSFTGEIVSLFNDLARNQFMELKFETEIKNNEVLFDHDKIEKVLFNLLSNAFKYTPPGGRIMVRIKQQPGLIKNETGEFVESEANHAREKLVFELEDTGKGISAEHLPYIFERFYQINEASHHHKFDSSGIGLSYVKDLVTLHNGSITVTSEPEKGTKFVFEIPCVYAASEEDIEETGTVYNPATLISENSRSEIENMKSIISLIAEEENSGIEESVSQAIRAEKLMVLVVEDEPELREFLRGTLETDYEVIDARNGVIGYNKAVDYQPDVIVTDVMMPEMDGYEFCRRLKTNLATNHIPVIMLTARISPENKLEGYQTGADSYIEKPFSTDLLKVRISNLLQAKEKTREKILRELITQPSEIEVHSEDDKMLRKIQVVLEENISNSDFDVESMSQHFFLSRCHFSRKIKQITGLTPKEIIDSYRLKRASQLLQQKITITEVAYMVGFDHPNSFSRAFRKFYNMTPSEFASQN
jgi:signal transduction histidine kinase/DNA-binding response OmpR family regulator